MTSREDIIAVGAYERPELARYVVAVKNGRYWDPQDTGTLLQAQANYDAGVSTMCQHRVCTDAYLQLEIPLTTPVERPENKTFRWARTNLRRTDE